ncbi:hypothetical protein GCM10027341_55490 [Spirosoma knui]
MRTYQLVWVLTGLLVLGQLTLAVGQANDKLVYLGANLLAGIGRYNGIKYGAGVSGRFQYPLTTNVALTAKVGLEVYRVSSAFLVPNSYLGYGYSPISGFGFNTLYYNFYSYESVAMGLAIPICFGPRVYLNDRAHVDLNVGVDIAANASMVSSLHVEPSAGYLLPLPNGGKLDLNAGYFTSFAKGSGVFTIGAAFGLSLKNN